MKRPIRTGEEEDALTGWRRFLFWKPGEVSRIKRRYRRKERRAAKREVRDEQSMSPEEDKC